MTRKLRAVDDEGQKHVVSRERRWTNPKGGEWLQRGNKLFVTDEDGGEKPANGLDALGLAFYLDGQPSRPPLKELPRVVAEALKFVHTMKSRESHRDSEPQANAD